MTTSFFRSFIFSFSLYLSLCSRHTHTVSIPSHPFAYDTLRYLTRSNVTVRTRATLSPKIKKNTVVNACRAAKFEMQNAPFGESEDLWNSIRRDFLIMNDRFEGELCVLSALSILRCHIFSKKYQPSTFDLNSCALLSRQFRARARHEGSRTIREFVWRRSCEYGTHGRFSLGNIRHSEQVASTRID